MTYLVFTIVFYLYFRLNNQNELSLKIYLVCFNIEKNMYLAKKGNDGNWMSRTTVETLKKALHSNDENVC